MIRFVKKYKKVKQYSKLAQVYDYVMRHVDYVGWAKFVDSVLKMNGIKFGHIIDLSCGTGTFLMELNEYGYKLYGSDVSREMVKQAQSKCSKKGINITLYVGDMRTLRFEKRFDGAVSLFDSINYLRNEEDVLENLVSVASILNDNGIFIFDICTEANSLKNFNQYTEKGEYNNIFYHRKSYYLEYDHLQINDIKIIDKKTGEHYREIHRQRIYTAEEIKNIVTISPLRLVNMYDGFSFNPPDSQTERIHFVLEKK